MMLKTLSVVFVAVVVLLSTPSHGYNDLQDYLNNYNKPLEMSIDTGNSVQCMDKNARVQECTMVEQDVIAGITINEFTNNSDLTIVDENQAPEDMKYTTPTWFLPYKPNKALYMTLAEGAGLPTWIFSFYLNGCEIWIATKSGAQPTFFHINYNDCPSTVEALAEKAQWAKEAIEFLPGYEFVYRLIETEGVKDLDEYLTQFAKDNPGVEVAGYEVPESVIPVGGIPYAQYNSGEAPSDTVAVYDNWSFKLKKVNDGSFFPVGTSIIPGSAKALPSGLAMLSQQGSKDVMEYISDAEIIDYEIQDKVSKVVCPQRVAKVSEGVYKFGDSLHLVRIIHNTLMVRGKGYWEPLDQFLNKQICKKGN